MSTQLAVTQLLNGLQFGVFLFLMSAGLTLVLGVMNFVNLAHGSLFMVGAYVAAVILDQTGSFIVAVLGAVIAVGILGLLLQLSLFRRLQNEEPLRQVLATFGLTLFFNELVRIICGSSPLYMQVPDLLSGTVSLFGISYPAYRLLIVGFGLAVAVLMWLLVHKTRIGMLIRAGATNQITVDALGVNIIALNAGIFTLGACLAGFAGAVAGPLLSVQSGMGDPILILTLVVIVVGGLGSSKGAFVASLGVGLIDTAGRAFIPLIFRSIMDRSIANAAGPAVASMLIYCVMAAVLAFKPDGLFSLTRGNS